MAESERNLRLDKARDHAAADVPTFAPGATKSEILRAMAGRKYASATHIAVCEGGKFLGIIRIEDLLSATEGVRAADMMDSNPPQVAHGMDQEVAAWKAVQHGETALAVVDGEGRFIGVIPPIKLLQVLLEEHEEDLSRLGGFLKSTANSRASALENVIKRFGHRLPWLFLGLLGAMISTDIVGRFESMLRDQILLAFFIPGIVYLADAVGTQTETLIVRGLSVGVRLRQVVIRELLTGIAIGLVLGAFTFLFLAWRWDQPRLALGVGLSVFATCSTATVTAMALPWALNRVGADPAFGSGPMATVIQDILSIAIYFFIASIFA